MREIDTVIFTKDKADILSIALIQPKAGPPSSGTPFLVCFASMLLCYVYTVCDLYKINQV